jgi:hypothetical protein
MAKILQFRKIEKKVKVEDEQESVDFANIIKANKAKADKLKKQRELNNKNITAYKRRT